MTRTSIASQLAKIDQEILNAAKARARVRLAELIQAEQDSRSNDRILQGRMLFSRLRSSGLKRAKGAT